MAKLAINFDEVPDHFQPLPSGEYVLKVLSIEDKVIEAKKPGGPEGEKLVVEFQVDDETNPHHGRKIYNHMNKEYPIPIKRLAKSCGISVGADGLDTDLLINKNCRARVKESTYTDKATGETKPTSNIAEFLF